MWNSVAAYGLHAAVVEREVVRDELCQSLILSAYGRADKDPFRVFCWFRGHFNVLLPNRPAFAGRARPRSQGRWLVAKVCHSRAGSPNELAVLFCCLLQALRLTQRLCVAVIDSNIKLSYDEKRSVLSAQLASTSLQLRQTYSIAYSVDVFWPFVDQWVGVEFYRGSFNCGAETFTKLPDTFRAAEFRPAYLRKYEMELYRRIPPVYDRAPAAAPQSASVQDLLMFDSDDDDASDASGREAPPQSATLFEPAAPLAACWATYLRKRRLELEAVHMGLTAKDRKLYVDLWGRDDKGRMIVRTAVTAILAASAHGLVHDVSPRFLEVGRCSKNAVGAGVTATRVTYVDNDSLEAQHLFELDQRHCRQLITKTHALPTSVNGFRQSEVYVIKAVLKQNELIAPEAQMVGLFKGEPVYARDSVMVLYTRRKLQKMGREVPEDARPVKLDRKGNPMFDLEQSRVIDQATVTNQLQQGRSTWPVATGLNLLPSGYVHLRDSEYPAVSLAAFKLQIPHFGAMTGYQYVNRCVKPVYDGIVVQEQFVDPILERQRYFAEKQNAKKEAQEQERVVAIWRALCKMVLAVEHQSR